jgi:effector-binding domain-containing protein
LYPFLIKKPSGFSIRKEDDMTPFREIRNVPPMKAIGARGNVSLWDVDTAFSRLYDKALGQKLLFRQPGLGIRRGELRAPEAFEADYEVLFPLVGEFPDKVEGMEVLDLPGEEVACFIHRGPYERIGCMYEKVLDWLRENRYEVAGETREIFFVAPEPHAGGTQDDMLTEIQVPIRLRSSGAIPAESRDGQNRKAA